MSAGYHACLVVGGCHSLVLVQKEMVGDPLETASINSIGWRYSNDEGIARPLQVHNFYSLDYASRVFLCFQVILLCVNNDRKL